MPDVNPLDDIVVLSQDEKPISEKLLVILGGITSFGTILPLILGYAQKSFVGSNLYFVFKLFIILYFLGPALLLLLWVLFFRRIIVGDAGLSQLIKNAQFCTLTFLSLQIVLGSAVILGYKDEMGYNQNLVMTLGYIGFTLFFLVSFVITVIRPQGRRLRDLWGWFAATLVLIIVAGCIFYKVSQKTSQVSTGNCDAAIRKLTTIAAQVRDIAAIEKNTRGVSERYRLKSNMEWESDDVPAAMILDFSKIEKDTFCIRRYEMKPYIYFFDKMILSNSNNLRNMSFRDFLSENLLDSSVHYNDSSFLNAEALYNAFRTRLPDSETGDSSTYIHLIDSTLLDALDAKRQLVKLLWDSSKKKDMYIFTLLNAYPCTQAALRADTLAVITKFSHYMDERNSKQLYEWMQDFIAYLQRRAAEKISKTTDSIGWIFTDTRQKGILIFGTLAFNIFVFSVLLVRQKGKMRKIAIAKAKEELQKKELLLVDLQTFYAAKIAAAGGTPNRVFEKAEQKKKEKIEAVCKKNTESIKNKLENDYKIIDFHLFPAITVLSIVVALLIPLCKPIKTEEINTTRPDWFLNIPNWNITEKYKEVVSCSDCPLKQPDNGNNGKDGKPGDSPVLNTGNLATKEDVINARDSIVQTTEVIQTNIQKIVPYK